MVLLGRGGEFLEMIVPQINLKVNLSEQALEYVKKRGGVLTLKEAPQTGCCTNVVFVGAHSGKPQEEGYFGVKEQDDIRIFYDPFIIRNDKQYEVVLEGFLKWKTLSVY